MIIIYKLQSHQSIVWQPYAGYVYVYFDEVGKKPNFFPPIFHSTTVTVPTKLTLSQSTMLEFPTFTALQYYCKLL